jgi:hypothetical protein
VYPGGAVRQFVQPMRSSSTTISSIHVSNSGGVVSD